MVLNYLPKLESQNNQTLVQLKNWNDPRALSDQFIESVSEASRGYLNYKITSWQDVDAIPVKQDGFQYTDETYLKCLQDHGTCHASDITNYNKILTQFSVCDKVNQNQIDELWLWGGPWFGYYEARIAGPNAF